MLGSNHNIIVGKIALAIVVAILIVVIVVVIVSVIIVVIHTGNSKGRVGEPRRTRCQLVRLRGEDGQQRHRNNFEGNACP